IFTSPLQDFTRFLHLATALPSARVHFTKVHVREHPCVLPVARRATCGKPHRADTLVCPYKKSVSKLEMHPNRTTKNREFSPSRLLE
ncbi:MAG: hypothetical protein JXA10_01620, partial [Anaerolineae bacterium]|nr:hypothetical protein [Anaerolineae bacterium]